MWGLILQNIAISLLIIMIVHNLVIYLKDTYTVSKIKDVTGIQVQKYKTIIEEIDIINKKRQMPLPEDNKNNLSQNDLLTIDEDLNDYLRTQIINMDK